MEMMEDRQLMTAALAPLSDITVPAQLGYQVPLNGSGDTDPAQTYTVTSDNPRIAATVATGPYWTLNLQHNASSTPGDISFSGSVTFQLFQDLLGNAPGSTISEIETFTNNGYYTNKDFTRVAIGFPTLTDYVAQGGAPNPDGTGSSNQPGTPFADQFNQQLAFTGTQQLAMANAGPNTNDTQFFVTTGTPAYLDFKHTIFGQLVAGSNILVDMTKVSKQANPALGGEKSLPASPITITSATISNASVNGVVHIDTTSARPGDTANITVTATDPTDGSHVTESFKVTVSAYNGPTTKATVPINFVPFASPVSSTAKFNAPVTVQLSGQNGFPDATTPPALSFQLLSQPAHGTISNFNPTNGTLTYTPSANYSGPDTFQYQVLSTGPNGSPATTSSLPATVALTVETAPPVIPPAPPVIPPVPPVPLVTVSGVSDVMNKRHLVTQIVVQFSGAVNTAQGDLIGNYRLTLPGRRGLYTARNAPVIKLKKAVYDSATKRVTLTLRTPLALTKRKPQLLINGSAPSGLTDNSNRLIDGDHNGTPGGNAIAYFSKAGVTMNSVGR